MIRRAAAIAFAVIAFGAPLAGCANSDDAPEIGVTENEGEFEHEYVIDAGTAERIADGEEVAIVPRELEVAVGESIRIINHDDVNHTVGLFYVPANGTLTQTFKAPGTLEGECTVHPSGQFTLTVNRA